MTGHATLAVWRKGRAVTLESFCPAFPPFIVLSFVHQVFVEHALCVRHCARFRGALPSCSSQRSGKDGPSTVMKHPGEGDTQHSLKDEKELHQKGLELMARVPGA